MVTKRFVRTAAPIDLFPTFQPLRRGPADPTTRLDRNGVSRASRGPAGDFTIRFESEPDGIRAEAWGPGAEWAIDIAPKLVGAGDDWSTFEPKHPLVRDLHRRMTGVRFPSWPTVAEILVPTILEQKVIASTAKQAYRKLCLFYGERAPGPLKLWLPPAPKVLAALPYYEFHPLGVEKRRAGIVKEVCARAGRLDQVADLPAEQRRNRLEAIFGVGAWTSAEVARIAWGDPDAVSVNDFHLPHIVSWALAGEARGTDERMLELLEPYRGQRARAVRLIEAAGLTAPKFGPRLAVRPIAAI